MRGTGHPVEIEPQSMSILFKYLRYIADVLDCIQIPPAVIEYPEACVNLGRCSMLLTDDLVPYISTIS
jgi:hypothetical protein